MKTNKNVHVSKASDSPMFIVAQTTQNGYLTQGTKSAGELHVMVFMLTWDVFCKRETHASFSY